jgi:ABC-2 type transport system permease protein
MKSIFLKEVNSFFSSLIGYIVIGVFLIVMGLFLWVFPNTNLIDYGYAGLDELFITTPNIFMFLIPAITMRLLAEEHQTGTIELLATRPLTDLTIILAKYFAAVFLVFFALFPTLIYYYSVYQLGSPVGNVDSGAFIGSFLGLVLLGASFVAIGMFASSLTKNQIVAFIVGVFMCFMCYRGFDLMSNFPGFVGTIDYIIEMLGINYHYNSISRGILDTRDILYFISFIAFFIALTNTVLQRRKW